VSDVSVWRLDGRVAVVTGASKGIGWAVTRELVDLGAHVIGCARTIDRLAGFDAGVTAVAADITTSVGRDAVCAAVAQRGCLDILVNNAGKNVRKPTLQTTPADFAAVLALNLEAVWRLTLDLHPYLRQSDAASVINIGSVASQLAVRPSTASYAASKGGVEAMTRFLAAEWGPDQIRVNSVAPWYVRTPLAEPVLADPEKRAAILARTPLGRVGEPEDVARAVAFLAMPASSWVTGTRLDVDGGFSALGA
jgi:Tropinone reductase 1